MIQPKYLRKGDKIKIVAPSGKIAQEKVMAAKDIIEGWGLEADLGDYLFDHYYGYASNDSNRVIDLQKAFDDDSVKAILCARGGYGIIRIIDKLDFSRFHKDPKWIVGFSDVTILHAHINHNYNIETLHATMAAGLLDSKTSAEWLRKGLFGEKLEYEFVTHELSRPGKSLGQLSGGNLAMINSLMGSVSEIDTRGKVLFIEEIGEHLYRIDRLMWQLKRAGKLDAIEGLIVGGMTDIPDEKQDFGMSAYEVVLDAVKNRSYPVCFGFPAGHQKDNRAMIMGRKVELTVDSKTGIKFTDNYN